MSKVTTNIESDVEIAFDELIEKNQKNRRPILLAGAEVVAKELDNNTPRGVRTRRYNRARDKIAISNIRTDKETFEGYLAVGYQKGVAHRIHVSEFGSMYQRPQGFITKTVKKSERNTLSAMRRKGRELM